MGGIHVSMRETNDEIYYIGMQNKLMLPSSAKSISESSRNIKPEFINGVYKGSYGLDIGVVYEDNAFKLFYWALEGTPAGSQASVDKTISGATFGEQITLKTYLNGNKVTCAAIRSNGSTTTLDCPLSAAAQAAFASGVIFKRELVIAADERTNGGKTVIENPAEAYFYDATFSEGFVTTSDNVRHTLNDDNSFFTNSYTDGNIDIPTLRTLNVAAGYDTNGYSYETASCDLRSKA